LLVAAAAAVAEFAVPEAGNIVATIVTTIVKLFAPQYTMNSKIPFKKN
jgi:hypothetical protein